MAKKPISNEQVLEKINQIKAIIDDGWSIHIAKKKILGSDHTRIGRAVMSHQAYCDILNQYVIKTGFKMKYDFVDKVLTPRKRS